MKMYITELQARELLANRVNSTFDNQGKRVYNRTGKAAKKRIYAEVRHAHGIPHSRKIKFFIEDPTREHYRVISDKVTGEALDNGIAAPVAVAVAAPVAPKAKAPAKTAAPKAKAPAKTAAKTAKPAAKVVKAPVKAVAKAKTVAKAPAKSVTKAKPAAKVVKPAAKAVKTVAKPAAKKIIAKKSK